MTVRPATEADLEAVVDLLEAVVAEGRWLGAEPPIDRAEHLERLREGLSEPSRRALLVAEADGTVVGHLGLGLASYGVANLSMFVAAGWRGRGIGSALVAEALSAARELGAHKVALQVWPNNRAALALYTRFGFATEGVLRRHYRRGDGALWDAVVMGLVLDEDAPGGPSNEPWS